MSLQFCATSLTIPRGWHVWPPRISPLFMGNSETIRQYLTFNDIISKVYGCYNSNILRLVASIYHVDNSSLSRANCNMPQENEAFLRSPKEPLWGFLSSITVSLLRSARAGPLWLLGYLRLSCTVLSCRWESSHCWTLFIDGLPSWSNPLEHTLHAGHL